MLEGGTWEVEKSIQNFGQRTSGEETLFGDQYTDGAVILKLILENVVGCEVVNYISLAQDEVQCQTFVDTLIKLQVS
jgi:hypothetical protein